MDLLFVYGTLRSEFGNEYARLLRSQAELVGRAAVRGSIYRVEFYPAYRPQPAAEVHGEVYRLRDPEATFGVLDAYEGDDFERILVETTLGDAWIYRYRHNLAAGARISSGDFCAE